MFNADEKYISGQRKFEIKDNIAICYFKDGKVKAKGGYIDGFMQGEWQFYRATGQLWAIGSFKDDKKHGIFKRYDKDNNLEFEENFIDGKTI